jgi:hypothetical protein
MKEEEKGEENYIQQSSIICTLLITPWLGKTINTYNILVGKSQGRRPKNNGRRGVDWI